MAMTWPEKWLLAGAALTVPAAAAAAETVTYSYDALGRLVGVSTSSDPNDGMSVSTGYDPAGNRASYGVSGADSTSTATASRTSSSDSVMTGLAEEEPAEGAPAAAVVEPPPSGGIPDESEPVVEIEPPEGAEKALGADR
jgi:hypothetical protein